MLHFRLANRRRRRGKTPPRASAPAGRCGPPGVGLATQDGEEIALRTPLAPRALPNSSPGPRPGALDRVAVPEGDLSGTAQCRREASGSRPPQEGRVDRLGHQPGRHGRARSSRSRGSDARRGPSIGTGWTPCCLFAASRSWCPIGVRCVPAWRLGHLPGAASAEAAETGRRRSDRSRLHRRGPRDPRRPPSMRVHEDGSTWSCAAGGCRGVRLVLHGGLPDHRDGAQTGLLKDLAQDGLFQAFRDGHRRREPGYRLEACRRDRGQGARARPDA